ncbi:hypothetical protein [Gloeobacter morelensis]|uniref:Uncharacterized protein n=1 Tax=Gloeobacter morelensis MG652769 TaxID=2781736 RepID=A0ABY3PM81_9CYAN|nr:hypothetical protein [Gloeobacter morelensis]UFP94802.1 hypothetical protein ISF26_00680 [Gloeobacter morelensis MG652769]
MSNTLLLPVRLGAALAIVLCTAAPQVLAQPALRAQPPTVTEGNGGSIRTFRTGVQKIAAGTRGDLIVTFVASGPVSALTVEEGKAVQIPVSGRMGDVKLPSGSMLLGALNRLDEKLGQFVFDTLVIENRVYKVQAMSDPVPGKLRADPYSLQTVQDGKDLTKSYVRERRGVTQGRTTSSLGRATGSMVGAIGGTWGSYRAGSAIGALGGLIGALQQQGAVNQSTGEQEEILERDIPSVLVADLSPLQSLSVEFMAEVDMTQPQTELSPAHLPGQAVVPNAANTPAMMYPVSPVGPAPVYPSGYGYNSPYPYPYPPAGVPYPPAGVPYPPAGVPYMPVPPLYPR